MHTQTRDTQTDTAEQITGAGGDHSFTIKGNQPKLLRTCNTLPWKDVPSHTTRSRGPARTATRTITVANVATRV